jgi:lambda repressor-like predicted transcriptional regulator
MERRQVITQDQIDRIVELREQGKTLGQIERLTGVKQNTADYHLRRLCVFPPGWKHRGATLPCGSYMRNGYEVKGFTPDDDARLEAMDRAGMRLTDMARELGRSHNTVKARLVALANHAECASEEAA